MSARDELRARLPKGFIAAREGSAPRVVWAWPIGLGLLCVLVLVGFFGWRMMGDPGPAYAGGGLTALHPRTAEPATITMWHVFPMGYGPDRELRFAAWNDGTVIWTESTVAQEGAPFRVGRRLPSEIRDLIARLLPSLQALPNNAMSASFVDGGYDRFILDDGDHKFLLDWGSGFSTDKHLPLGPVWQEVKTSVLDAIPSQGEQIAREAIQLEYRR